MFHGVLALIERSLRVDSRSLQAHLARFGLMAAIYVALCLAQWNAATFGAPGLRFFYGISYLNLTFMTLLGISFFSTSISEEKEQDTLGLMLMAGISPLGILIGKSGGRLLQALLLIVIQYAFTLLAITMGGVTHAQVSAAYFGLISYMIFLAGLGLLCSVIGSNNRSATALMLLGLCIYTLIPRSAAWILEILVANGTIVIWRIQGMAQILEAIARLSVFEQMGWILTTGFGDSRFSWQVASNLAGGIFCFGLAWGLFGVFSRQPATESMTRGLVARSSGRYRWFSPGRPWSNPFLWKDFYFVSGGFGLIPARLGFCLILYLIAMMQNGPRAGGPSNLYMDVSFFQVFLSLAVSIDAGRVMAQSLNDEIRNQTLSLLLMLPRTPVFVIYSKLAGAMLGWLPGIVIEIIFTMITDQGRRNFSELCLHPIGVYVTAFFILIPNLAALLSVYLRWGAVPLAFAVTIGAYIGVVSILQAFTVMGEDSWLFMVMGLFVFALSVVCHIGIMLRISQLASTT